MHWLARLALCAPFLGCSSLGSSDTGLRGTLVIAGGGMSSRSLEVREAFLSRRVSGKVGVIGAASAEPDASAARGVRAMDEAAGAAVSIALPFNEARPELADDPEMVALIEGCGALWFTGGSQSRIIKAMRPDGSDSAAWLACMDLLARGGVIGGSSAGAAMMSDPMIRRGRSADALVEGVGSEGVEVGLGMGFFPWGICGQHFLERGRFGRMVVALGETGRRFGWGVSEDSALLVDRATGWVEVMGPSGLALFDTESLKSSTGRWDSVELALLSTGDRVHAPTGEVEPAPSAAPRRRASLIGELVIEELWGPKALREACLYLARGDGGSARLTAVDARALLREGDETRAWRVEGDPPRERWSVQGVRLDVYRMTE
jgi:cyanophycinase